MQMLFVFLLQGLVPPDMSSFDPAKLAASSEAQRQWYDCLRKSIPIFASKRSPTIDEAATAVLTTCRSYQLADEKASEDALTSSVGYVVARNKIGEINRKSLEAARNWVVTEIIKARP